MRFLVFCCSFLTVSIACSQVIYVEEIEDHDKKGISAGIELEYDYNKSKEIDMEFINKLFLRWDSELWTFYLFNEIDYNRTGNKDLANDGQQHFRVSYHVKEKYSIESFVQNKHDLVLNIENRVLAAVGLKSKFPVVDFIGFYVFYENEELVDGVSNQDLRLSLSNQFSVSLSEKLKFSNKIHYQPKIEDIYDYRLALEASIYVPILKNLFFKNTFVLAHDTHPAFDIPNTTYQIKNGLIYTFQQKNKL